MQFDPNELNNLDVIEFVIQEIEQSCTDLKFELQKTAADPKRLQFYTEAKIFIKDVQLLARKFLVLEEEIKKQLNVAKF